MDPPGPHGVKHADCLLNLGDSIPPAGSTHKGSPVVQYVLERGIATKDFTSYGSHRGFKRIHCICGLGIFKKKNGGETSCIFQNSSTGFFSEGKANDRITWRLRGVGVSGLIEVILYCK